MTFRIVNKKSNIKIFIVMFLLISQLFSLTLAIKAQNTSGNSGQLKGNTNKVLTIPNGTVDAGRVILASDRDNDGMSDEDELQNGTNPDDPSDADGDLDGDGVSNGDEVARGTNPNSADSDGDGVSDAEEIRLGYNPLDANNTPPPNTAIVSISVTPGTLSLVVNQIFGQEPKQLTVTGITNTGTTVDLTTSPQTTYQSLDPSIAVVTSSGLVAAGAAGSTVIEIHNGGFSAQATVQVASFAPTAAGFIQIPGFANSVTAANGYAYVAAGAAGLQIVNPGNGTNPQIIGSIDTPGNANDVKVVGNRAYIADGEAGLIIIDISNPASPVSEGSVDTPGEAGGIAVEGNFAYVADGDEGLQIINISNPSAPVITGSVNTPGTAKGVDVSQGFAVLAESYPSSGIRIVNVSDPASPQLVGALVMDGDVNNVAVRNRFAYVAGLYNGFGVVDFSNPAAPFLADSYPTVFVPQDVALSGDYAFLAETFQNNFVPIFNIGVPQSLNYRGGIDFGSLGSAEGTGIAVDEQFVYLTADSPPVNSFGSSGFTKLFIGRYKTPASDTAGNAPTVTLTAPANGDTVKEGDILYLSADANDDIYVAGVEFKVNGVVVGNDSTAPYEFFYQAPINVGSLSITAGAFDLGGNTATSDPVSITVTPDPPPVIDITNPAEGTTLTEGQIVVLKANASDNQSVTQVSFAANGVEAGVDTSTPYSQSFTVPNGISFLELTVTATDDVGHTTSAGRVFTVVPDPKTVVTGRVIDEFNQPTADATVIVQGNLTAQTGSDGTFIIQNAPTWQGYIQARTNAAIGNERFSGASARVIPVVGGTTDVGDIVLKPLGKVVTVNYQDGDGELFLMDGDGANQTRLTDNDRHDFAPYFSPDGSKILYTSQDPCGYGWTNRIIGADGRNPVDLGSWLNYGVYDATAWSPDSRQLVFGSQNGLYIVNADGTDKRQIVSGWTDYASWSRDGAKITFISYAASYMGEVYSVNPDGSNLLPLTNTAKWKYYTVTSPDGSKVAFVQDDGDTENIYVVNTGGGNLKKITNSSNSRYWQLTWSPDSTRISAVMQDESYDQSIVTFYADANTPSEQINAAYADSPTWSPDGSQIIYGENGNLYKANPDGTDIEAVDSSGNSYTPNWSPGKTPSPDPGTIVSGRVVDENNLPVSNARIKLFDEYVATTGADGSFTSSVAPALRGDLRVFATSNNGGKLKSGFAAPIAPVSGGTTFVGDIRISEKIVFIRYLDNHTDIYSMDANGDNQQQLTNYESDKYYPVLSPDGTKILFNEIDYNYGDKVYMMNLDGSGLMQVYIEGGRCGGATTDSAMWSPDGTKLILSITKYSNTDIQFTGAEGKKAGRVKHGRERYKKDSRRSDIAGFAGSNTDIYVMDLSTGIVTGVTTDGGYKSNPEWSPDGSKILFIGEQNDSTEIYIMDTDGSNRTQVTNNTFYEDEPDWSADGSKIVYSSYRDDGFYSIHTINIDGSNETQITYNISAYDPSWSSDGSRIAFVSDQSGEFHIYTMNSDGTDPVQLTNGINEEFYPYW